MAEQTVARLRAEDVAAGAAWIRENARAHAERLAPVYAALDWRWGNDAAPPTVDAIHSAILRLAGTLEEPGALKFAAERGAPVGALSGGLEVCVGIDPEVGPGVRAWVKFVDVQHEGVG